MGASAKVTVGMPVFNGEKYLKEALDSVLAQSYSNFEVALCDNASSDATPEICREYAARDNRIRFYESASNRGAAWNYNRAFEVCNTPYFMWQAHDDRLDPGFLTTATSVLDREPEVVLCYSRVRFIDDEGVELEVVTNDLELDQPSPSQRFADFLRRYRAQGYCNPIFGLFRSDVLRKTGVIGPFPSSDMILLGETALHGVLRELPQVLFERRLHSARSVEANPSFEDRAEWFVPGSGGKRQYIKVRWFVEYLRSIKRAELDASERLKCTASLLREQIPVAREIAEREARVAAKRVSELLKRSTR